MTGVHVFLDVREDYASAQGGHAVVEFGSQEELDSILQRLGARSWEYPVRIVWREPGDRRWSHMVIMRGTTED